MRAHPVKSFWTVTVFLICLFLLSTPTTFSESLSGMRARFNELDYKIKQWKDERQKVTKHIAQCKRLVDKNRFKEAQNEIDSAKKLHPKYPPVVEAEAQLKSKEAEEKKKAKESAERLAKAKDHFKQGKLDEAIKIVEEQARLNPNNKEASTLAKKWKTQKEATDRQVERIKKLIEASNFTEAKKALTTVKEFHPKYPPAVEIEGLLKDREAAHKKQEELKRAEKEKKADQEKKAESARKIAEVKDLVAQGRLSEAMKAAEGHARANPSDQQAVALVKRVKTQKEATDRQVERIKKLIEASDFPKAKKALASVKEFHPKYPPVLEVEELLQKKLEQAAHGKKLEAGGVWRHGGGGETWTLTPRGDGAYAAVEKGFGNASGTAKEDEPPAQQTHTYARTKVLFNGTMDENWTEYSAHGGNFASHAKLTDNGLLVEVPEKSDWGTTGIFSSKPLIWLDDFGDEAEYHLSFDFIPEKTTGFAISLLKNLVVSSQPHAYLRWTLDPTTDMATFILRLDNSEVWKKTVSGKAPKNISFTLRPGKLIISQENIPLHVHPWPDIAPYAGYRVSAYSQAYKQNMPVKMALKKITLSSDPGEPIKTAKPAPDVAELPIKTLFSGELGENWETIGIAGGNFKKFGRFENGKMIVSVPAKHCWGKTGLLSKKPLLTLDSYTTDKAPYRLQIKVDPKQSKGFVIAFDGSKNAEMWPSHRLWIHISKAAFYYHTQYAGAESREKPENWNGIVNIVIGDGWFSVQLSDGKTMRSQVNMKSGQQFYMTVISHPDSEHGASSLTLESITLQKIAPEGMTAVKRWELVDGDEFDADAFLNDMRIEFHRTLDAIDLLDKKMFHD